MRALYLFLALFMFVGCDKNNCTQSTPIDPPKDITIQNIDMTDIMNLVESQQGRFDDELLFTKLTTKAYVYGRCFEYYNNEWINYINIGGPGYLGYTFDGATIKAYYIPVYYGQDDYSNEIISQSYHGRYDNSTKTLYTSSISHDYEYEARVIYFDDEMVIFEGVLCFDDYMNDDFAERNYIYVGSFSEEDQNMWVERIIDDWEQTK